MTCILRRLKDASEADTAPVQYVQCGNTRSFFCALNAASVSLSSTCARIVLGALVLKDEEVDVRYTNLLES